jgi:hypothetical protein
MCPLVGLCFVTVFSAFNNVVKSCFGCVLAPEFTNYLREFRDSYMDLVTNHQLPVTPKVHAVFYHVEEFCSRRGTGLGLWSQQSTESLHRDFLVHWQRYEVAVEHPCYSERLLAAVCSYNSRHI